MDHQNSQKSSQIFSYWPLHLNDGFRTIDGFIMPNGTIQGSYNIIRYVISATGPQDLKAVGESCGSHPKSQANNTL